jgi:antirestriction protein ArdC
MARMKTDNYETITAKFVDALQAVVDGTSKRLPWQRDWRTLGAMRNGIKGNAYKGMNVWLLAMEGYTDPRWATRNQIMTKCGYTKGKGKFGSWTDKDGEKAPKGIFPEYDKTDRATLPTTVTFWKFIPAPVKDKDGNVVKDDDGNPLVRRIPLLKLFRVYNFEQITWPEGKEPKPLTDDTLDVDPDEVHAEAERVFSAYLEAQGLTVTYKGDKAYYNITDDTVTLPEAKAFRTAEGFQRTKAHELVHSTGAKGRLNRNLRNFFGSADYAREELVAELGAAFLCSDLGVSNEGDLDDNHTAYLMSWIKRLQDNKYEIFTAGKLARQAVAMVKGEAADASTDTTEGKATSTESRAA